MVILTDQTLGIYNRVYIQGVILVKMAKLFQNGSSQAVRLPKDFRFPGDEVYVKREGQAVVLLPRENFWNGLLESLDMFTDDFMDSRGQPTRPERSNLL